MTLGLAHVAAAQAGWSPPVIDVGPSQTGVFPFGHLVAGPNGDAVAVWPDGKWSLVAARYSGTSKKWNTAVTLSTPARQAYYPRVAINSSGNALAVWSEADSLNPERQELWFAGYAPTTNTWTERALLATNGSQPDVALDSAGNAIAVWLEPEPTCVHSNGTLRRQRRHMDAFDRARTLSVRCTNRAGRFRQRDGRLATKRASRRKVPSDHKVMGDHDRFLATGSYNAGVAVDGSGTVIVVYQAVGGLYAVWSEAQGLTWTTPVHVSTLEYPDWSVSRWARTPPAMPWFYGLSTGFRKRRTGSNQDV